MNKYKRLYIDIDGVINTMRRGPYKVYFIVDPDDPQVGVHIHMDSEVTKQFLGQFEQVVWASSWVNYPILLNQLESTLSLPVGKFDRIKLDRKEYLESPTHSSGKASAVAAHYDADPAPSLWIDDDLGPDDFKMTRDRDIDVHAPDPTVGAYKYMLRFGMGL